jgi:malonyl-CoA O-methyltransferase
MHYSKNKRNHKSAIARSFSRAANTYDQVALLQKEIGWRLLERLELIKLAPSKILDLGGGTGFFSQQLSQKYPTAQIINCDLAEGMVAFSKDLYCNQQDKISFLCADGDYLPLSNQSVDFVFSNCALQWFFDPVGVFQEIRRVLKPEGLLLFATFGQDTLKELRHSYSKIDDQDHVNLFLDMHDLGDILLQQQFQDPVMDMEIILLTYKTINGLIHDLKLTGAHHVNSAKTSAGLSPKSTFNKLSENYEPYRTAEGVLPATFEIVYGHAWRTGGPDSPEFSLHCAKNRIPITQI